jgi:hypothetical protein
MGALRPSGEALVGGLRQLLYRKEFRIARPMVSSEILGLVQDLARFSAAQANANSEATRNASSDSELTPLLRDIGIGLWRLRQKMVEPGTDRPLEEMRRAYRHCQSVWDALSEAGVEIQDHTGDPYDSGLSLSVLAFQPMPDLERERIIETVKPSIYYKKHRIQMGEVIVGRPESVALTERSGAGLHI